LRTKPTVINCNVRIQMFWDIMQCHRVSGCWLCRWT